MSEPDDIRNYRRAGIAAMVLGSLVAIVGALIAHFSGLDEFDSLGREIYPSIPRGWPFEVLGQVVSLGGVFLLLGGITLAFVYKREMTWARASIGAFVFVALMMIVFGVIPNQWLTLAQSDFAWTPQQIAITIPPALVLNNEVQISYAAIKDVVSGTYAVVALGGVAFAVYKWQEMQKTAATAPPPQPVSEYGRPLTKTRT